MIGGHPNKTLCWQRSYFFIKCDDSAFEHPPDDDYRVLWNTLLGRTPSLTRIISSYTNHLLFSLSFFFAADHPTSREYPEEFLAGARAVARLAQEHWGNISWERVRRSIDRISTSRPILFHVPLWTFTLSLVNESFLSIYPL